MEDPSETEVHVISSETRRSPWWMVLPMAVFQWGCASQSSAEGPDEPVGRPPGARAQSEIPTADEPEEDSEERAQGVERRERAGDTTLEGVFPNERVTLDFEQASVRRVFRLFRAKSRLELVLASEAKGRITISVEDAPVREAFRAVLEAADLVYDRRSEVLYVHPASEEGADDRDPSARGSK